MPRPRPPIDRFNEKWIEEDRGYKTPCHIWHGSTTKDGYGTFRVSTHVTVNATRFITGCVRGDGKSVDHLCLQVACVRRDHLEVVTPGENTLRAARNRDKCRKGHPWERPMGGSGKVRCLTCRRERDRAMKAIYRARAKAKAASRA